MAILLPAFGVLGDWQALSDSKFFSSELVSFSIVFFTILVATSVFHNIPSISPLKSASFSKWPSEHSEDEADAIVRAHPGRPGFPSTTRQHEVVTQAGHDSSSSVCAHLGNLAARDDLAYFWAFWRSLPDSRFLSSATRTVLAHSLGRASAVMADANWALDIAVAYCDAELGNAALATGAFLHCDSAWLALAYRRLSSCKVSTSPEHAVELVRAYCRESRADLAIDFWYEMRRSGRDAEEESAPRHTSDAVYAAALEACVSSGDLETAARAARSVSWRAPPSSSGQQALLAIARWFARRQDLTPALECYDSVRSAGGDVDLQTYRSLLAACVRNADMVQASGLFRDLVSSGLDGDSGIFSAMIRGYSAVGNLEQAMTFLHLMRRRGIKLEVSLFNALLDGCLSRRMLALVEQVLVDMEAVGVLPSNDTVAILVRLFGQEGNLQRALEIFEDLPNRHGFDVTSKTFGSVISACLSNARLDLAIEAFEDMKQAGCVAHARTYETLIAACLRQGDIQHAVCLIDDALGLKVTPLPNDTQVPQTCLQTKLVEDVLRLVGRRRLAKPIGEPLLERLGKVGFEVSETLASSIRRSAHAGVSESSSCSRLDWRREERLRWSQSFLA